MGLIGIIITISILILFVVFIVNPYILPYLEDKNIISGDGKTIERGIERTSTYLKCMESEKADRYPELSMEDIHDVCIKR